MGYGLKLGNWGLYKHRLDEPLQERLGRNPRFLNSSKETAIMRKIVTISDPAKSLCFIFHIIYDKDVHRT
jgi:hypothetical protein